jgi:hypothetical protein
LKTNGISCPACGASRAKVKLRFGVTVSLLIGEQTLVYATVDFTLLQKWLKCPQLTKHLTQNPAKLFQAKIMNKPLSFVARYAPTGSLAMQKLIPIQPVDPAHKGFHAFYAHALDARPGLSLPHGPQ